MDNHIRLQTLDWDEYTKTARQAAADGIVLLRNEKSVLPLSEGSRVSLFGRAQLSYYKSGTGSGGMVNVAHVTGIREALENEKSIRMNRELLHLYDRFNDENPPRTGDGWGNDPWSQDEMPVTDEICREAAKESDIAIVLIGRTAGEDRDNRDEEGSWKLSGLELDLLRKVRAAFGRMAVLLNTGNIIDMSFLDELSPDAVLYVWQGGMVGGLGVVDVLTGRVNPSGHLTDTIALSLEDYPSAKNFGTGDLDLYQEDIYVGYRYFESVARDRVRFPFGYGLSYTSFEIRSRKVETHEREAGSRLTIDLDIEVTNVGDTAGRSVVQVYARCPQGSLGKAARVLVDFMKTDLLEAGQSQLLSFRIPVRRFASYDDEGATGDVSCWVLEEGRYDLYVGENVRDAVCVTAESGAFSISNNWPIEQMEEALMPVRPFDRMVMKSSLTEEEPDTPAYIDGPTAADIAAAASAIAAAGQDEEEDEVQHIDRDRFDRALFIDYEPVAVRSIDDYKRIFENLPAELPYALGKGLLLNDVREGRCTMDEFIAQLSDKELAQIVRGEGMGSPLVTPGTAAAFGGVSEDLREMGIPAVCCDDGPSGMRLDCGNHAFSLPNGTMLACTFDRELNRKLFSFLGLEMLKNRVDCLLGPGINIHRHPLNGRNFEYFSEDPFLTGEIASAQIRGLQEQGVTGVIKHFCANNRESRRRTMDSAVSERALREIYLKGFEIAVREGKARAVMTSYGLLNGIHTSSLYDLTTTVLREEWGFDGIVMTDWWSTLSPKDVTENGLTGEYEKPDEDRLFRDALNGKLYDFSTMVRAQNDLYMVVPDGKTISGDSADTLDALEEGRLARAELQRSAANICRFAMETEAMRRLIGEGSTVTVENAPEDENLDSVEMVEYRKVPEQGLVLDLSQVSGEKGGDYLMGFELEAGAEYLFEFEGSCRAGELAQVPVTFFFTGIPLKTMIWNGTDGDIACHAVSFRTRKRNNIFRLHFGQNGVRMRDVKITKCGE